MKKTNRLSSLILITIFSFLLLTSSLIAGKIDPLLRSFYAQQKNPNKQSTQLDSNTTSSIEMLKNLMHISDEKDVATVYALIQTNGQFNRFEEYGISYNSMLNDIYTASLTADQIELLGLDEDIIKVAASVPCHTSLDESLSSMYASYADTIFGLRGSGVVVGIIDKCFDVWNPDFQHAYDSTTRILYYFDAGDDTGPSPYSYGTEFTSAQIDSLLVGHLDTEGHGTAMAGIAAGNGKKSKNGMPSGTYRGVAPLSSIIMYDLGYMWPKASTANIIDGISYIQNKADSLGMPWTSPATTDMELSWFCHPLEFKRTFTA